MKITDLLKPSSILLKGNAANKNEVINTLVDLIDTAGAVSDKEAYKQAVLQRESLSSTGIGDGIAIPHAKSHGVKVPALAAMTLPDGAEFDSLDGAPAHLIFLIAAPNTEENVHLEVLSRLSMLLMDVNFRNDLMSSNSNEDFLRIIDVAEREKLAEEEKANTKIQEGYRILGVTACPTGIAHTFMAAESLEKKAAELGTTIKVETNGSGGVKNRLTSKEIEAAGCIIIAADKEVEMARFNGKPVIFAKVADGIHKPEELIQRALKSDARIYTHTGSTETSEEGKDSIGRSIYKNLMNGVSHMLPFVIGGGILIALAFMFDGANAGSDIFGSGNQLSLFFKQIGDLAFGMMFPILAGFIAMAIADRPGLMVGMVGGYIASAGMSMTVPSNQWVSSGFFGALIAGFVAGYLILFLRKIFDKLPAALEGTKPILLYPLCGILLIGLIMVFIVNPPMAVFNTWLNNGLSSMNSGSKVILGIVLGGMMSIDFGGPLNKTAYVFGTASIASGQYDIMAAVMIGGMVPPLAIALATIVFKNKFTKAERQTTVTNFIMGFAFITEGAIPFAASDPIHVIPACAIGSAVAGGLSMLFACGSKAPHGGIFVVGIMDNPIMFVLSLLIGALVGMVLLGLLKKTAAE